MKVKHNFNLESSSKAGKGQTLTLFFNFSYGFTELHPIKGIKKYVPMRMSTGFTLTEKEWDSKRSKPKETYSFRYALSRRMAELVKVSEQLLADFVAENDKLPHPTALRESVKVKMGLVPDTQSSPLVTEVIDRIIAENAKLPINAKGKIRSKQVDKYITIKNLFNGFTPNGSPLKLDDLTGDILISFRNHINAAFRTKSGKSMRLNSMAKNNNTVLTIVNKAVGDLGYSCPLATNLKKYRLSETDAANANVFISRQTLKKIIETDTIGVKKYQNARNYMIICCLTGLRFQSMVLLNKLEIERVAFTDGNGRERHFYGFDVLLPKVSEGGIPVNVFLPIFAPVQDILDANGGKFPNFRANSGLNVQVKAFAKFANLDEQFVIPDLRYGEEYAESVRPLHEVVTLHVGRGSFITALRELEVRNENSDSLTHPLKAQGVVNKVYDKTTRREVAIRVVRQLIDKGDPLFSIKA